MALKNNGSSWHSSQVITWVVSMKFRLQIARGSTTRNNFHALFTFIRRGCGTLFAAGLFVVIKHNDFTKGLFQLMALLAGFVAPLFKLSKRDALDLGSSFHPAAAFEQLVVICVCVANMCDNCKLHSTSQRQFFGITYPVCPFLECMGNDGLQVVVGNLGKHFSDSAMDVALGLLVRGRTSLFDLARRVVLEAPGNPVGPVTVLGFAKAVIFIICITELATGEVDDLQGEMMPNSVDMVRQLLRVGVHLVLGLGLRVCQSGQTLLPTVARNAYRNNVYVEVALAALLLAPFRKLGMASRNEAEASGRVGGICQLR